MKITATSQFHGTLSVSFVGCKEGINIRRLRGPRSRFCLDYTNSNSHVCGCGYPVSRTAWDAGEKYGVEGVEELENGYIRFRVYDAEARAEAERVYREEERSALLDMANDQAQLRTE
jgi:hypothetical protein